MTVIKRSLGIEAPVANVFDFAADWENWPKFFEGVSDFNPTTDITRGNGASYAYKAKMFGMNVSVETTISEFVENEGWIGTAVKGLPHRTQWMFKPRDQQTMFTYVLSYRLPIPLIGWIIDRFFVRPAWEKIVERSLRNLKLLVEKV
jgi:uncharacterized membrane protein